MQGKRTYRERREAKAERLNGWAERREGRSDAMREAARAPLAGIPFGQPILVGHHSEKRHRRAIDRSHAAMGRAVENDRTAERMRGKAATIESQLAASIYDDDHDAIERLGERIAELEAKRARIKAYNATCRKGAPDLALLEAEERADLASSIAAWGDMQCPGGRFPAYTLTNLSGNLNRQKKRLARLLAAQETAS